MAHVFGKGSGAYLQNANVGPFWFVRDDAGKVLLPARRCEVRRIEEYGEFLTCPHGHYDVWETSRAKRLAENVARVLRVVFMSDDHYQSTRSLRATCRSRKQPPEAR